MCVDERCLTNVVSERSTTRMAIADLEVGGSLVPITKQTCSERTATPLPQTSQSKPAITSQQSSSKHSPHTSSQATTKSPNQKTA
ncbi:hypothetical protein EJ03DRAFT_90929 [Teratosphaeria nubilosa]|uniref:Uncharacterized protein n=1 Tax=Teratosphaeria nubilosa TaxID=161662 RepID=A0A6G1L9V6_9PEZI|nr:hypothetical protein EJ03DRAFT_90929 [Teratosphaeria nubilosa]